MLASEICGVGNLRIKYFLKNEVILPTTSFQLTSIFPIFNLWIELAQNVEIKL